MNRKARRSVLFFARDPHNVVVYERVLRRLSRDERIDLALTSKNEHTRPPNALFDGFDLPGWRRIHHRLARWRRFDLYLSPDVHLACPRSTIKAHTFHGISIKGRAYTTKVLSFDCLFLIGPYQRRRFEELGVLTRDDPRFVNVGLPKTDPLFDGSLDRPAFLRGLALDPSRPTLLYAPTWRPEASLYSHGEALIRALRGGPWNLVIKLHDLTWRGPDGPGWRERLARLAGPGVGIVAEPDATPAMFAADLLISDASSVANEFTLLDRPIVFIDVPALFAKYEATIDREGWGQRAGPVARTVEEVQGGVARSLERPEEYGEVRRRIAAEGFYHPGRATEVAVAEIYRLLGLEPPVPASTP